MVLSWGSRASLWCVDWFVVIQVGKHPGIWPRRETREPSIGTEEVLKAAARRTPPLTTHASAPSVWTDLVKAINESPAAIERRLHLV